MTFDLFMVWSDLCPSCCGNTGRLLHDICKYAGERIVAHGPLVLYFCSKHRLWVLGEAVLTSTHYVFEQK